MVRPPALVHPTNPLVTGKLRFSASKPLAGPKAALYRVMEPDPKTIQLKGPPDHELPDGTKEWYVDDILRQVQEPDGTRQYYVNGDLRLIHRFHGRTEWYLDGQRHRAEGPAVRKSGAPPTFQYWVYGQKHRLEGPAVQRIGSRGQVIVEWWVRGERLPLDRIGPRGQVIVEPKGKATAMNPSTRPSAAPCLSELEMLVASLSAPASQMEAIQATLRVACQRPELVKDLATAVGAWGSIR